MVRARLLLGGHGTRRWLGPRATPKDKERGENHDDQWMLLEEEGGYMSIHASRISLTY